MWLGLQVRGRKSQKPAALITFDDYPAYDDRMPQQFICLTDIALAYQFANMCATDTQLFGLLELDGLYYYRMFFSITLKEVNISHAVMPKTEIGSNHHPSNHKTLSQAIQEVIGAQVRDFPCKTDYDAVVNMAISTGKCQFLFVRGQAF